MSTLHYTVIRPRITEDTYIIFQYWKLPFRCYDCTHIRDLVHKKITNLNMKFNNDIMPRQGKNLEVVPEYHFKPISSPHSS